MKQLCRELELCGSELSHELTLGDLSVLVTVGSYLKHIHSGILAMELHEKFSKDVEEREVQGRGAYCSKRRLKERKKRRRKRLSVVDTGLAPCQEENQHWAAQRESRASAESACLDMMILASGLQKSNMEHGRIYEHHCVNDPWQ